MADKNNYPYLKGTASNTNEQIWKFVTQNYTKDSYSYQGNKHDSDDSSQSGKYSKQ